VPYVDLNAIHTPATGTVPPAAWGTQIRDNDEWLIDPPYCSVFASSAQSVNDSTTTALTANSENFDNDGMHSTVSNTSRITATHAGRYQFIASVNYAAHATGTRQVAMRVDGSTIISPNVQVASAGGSFSTALTLVANIVLTVGQYVECVVVQRAGVALNCTLTEFSAMFVTR
jgi:hypothetical protein